MFQLLPAGSLQAFMLTDADHAWLLCYPAESTAAGLPISERSGPLESEAAQIPRRFYEECDHYGL